MKALPSGGSKYRLAAVEECKLETYKENDSKKMRYRRSNFQSDFVAVEVIGTGRWDIYKGNEHWCQLKNSEVQSWLFRVFESEMKDNFEPDMRR